MIKCIAIDDEGLALDLLEDNIQRVPFLTLIKKCSSAFDALEAIETEDVDLIFTDIQMPGLTGIQMIKSLHARQPMIILVTAYERYALEGFNLDVLDYLLKPVSFERFLKACNKAKELYALKASVKGAEASLEKEHDYIFVNADYSRVKINIKEIAFIEGMKDYIKIHLSKHPKPIITRLSIKAMEEKLSTRDFIRVHKSFLVCIDCIHSIRNNKIHIEDHLIPVSDNYREELIKIINKEHT